MLVRHRDAAHDAADNADETLVSAADEEVLQVCAPIELLRRSAVDGSIIMAGESHDRGGRKHIGVDHMPAIIGHEPNRRFLYPIVPPKFLQPVLLFINRSPAVEICQCGNSNGA